jgi:hypothetical protein
MSPYFGQVQRAIQQHFKAGCRVAEMHAHHTVVDLSTVPIPLPAGPDRLLATLGCTGLVNATDRFRMGMLLGHNLLATIS